MDTGDFCFCSSGRSFWFFCPAEISGQKAPIFRFCSCFWPVWESRCISLPGESSGFQRAGEWPLSVLSFCVLLALWAAPKWDRVKENLELCVNPDARAFRHNRLG